jgi:hypothetical protein
VGGFRPGYSCESPVLTVCQDIANSLHGGIKTDGKLIVFSKVFDLVPHYRLIMNIAATGVDLRVVARAQEFLLGRSQSLM